MKNIIKLSVLPLSILCTSCFFGNSDTENSFSEEELYETGNLSANSFQQQPNDDRIKYFYMKDAQNGMVMVKSPLPASWQYDERPNASIVYQGPNNLKVYKTERFEYFYSNDPYTNQTAAQMGKQVSQPMPLDQIVSQQLKPNYESNGYTFLKSYPAEGVVDFWNRFASGMPQTGSRKSFSAIGSDFKAANGNHIMVLALLTMSQTQTGVIWSISTTTLEADADYFDKARDAYIHGVANTQINPQWQQYQNGQLAANIKRNDEFYREQMMKSAAAHKQRMAAINSNATASNNIAKTYSDILDISHAGYLKRDNINSAGHSANINMIGENTVIGNHQTGEHYTIPSTNKYYWVNNRGEYLGTDNPNFDPRINNQINDAEWTQFDVEQ